MLAELRQSSDAASTSSQDSFHSAVSSPVQHVTSSAASPSEPLSPPSPPISTSPSNRIVSKLAPSRTLRFFQKVSFPQTDADPPPPARRPPPIPSSSPRTPSKRAKNSADRAPRLRLTRANGADAHDYRSAHPFARNVSDKSSQESFGSSPYAKGNASTLSPSAARHVVSEDVVTTPERSPHVRASVQLSPVPSVATRMSPGSVDAGKNRAVNVVADGAHVDDWGLDVFSDQNEDGHTVTANDSFRAGRSQSHAQTTRDLYDRKQPGFLSSPEGVTLLAHEDTITLRAFDENTGQQAAASELPHVSNVIGMYADPAAETDDWGDDFELEEPDSRPLEGSNGSRNEEGITESPSWFSEIDPSRKEPEQNAATANNFALTDQQHSGYHPATAEIVRSGDDALRMRGLSQSAFETPVLTHSSLLTYPGIGYQAATVHPSCTRAKELFSRYDATIRRHFDALVRDSGGTVAHEERTRAVYSMAEDGDVCKLAKANGDLSTDVLVWKLEWANLNNDHAQRAQVLLALSRLFKYEGNYKEAKRIADDGLAGVHVLSDSNLGLALSVELEYECAVLSRALNAPEESERALQRAMELSADLSARSEEHGDLQGPQQRGLWWQLRCKFLLAEIAFDLGKLEEALQAFSEYIVESITRMIGIIAPPRSEDTTLGMEYMRYCLFSPRRLTLALWTTLLCLGEMRSFAAAADTTGLINLVASSFGYEDVRTAASSVRLRIKEIAVELRQQYDSISQTILEKNQPVQEDLDSLPVQSAVQTTPIDYDVGNFGDVGDDIEEDWDAQLEVELNITIQRCCDVDQSIENASSGEGYAAPSFLAKEASNTFLSDRVQQDGLIGTNEDVSNGNRKVHQSASQWDSGPRQGNLIEAELRQYLGRLGGATITVSAQQMFPKPTQPFDGRLMGPREHENFLRRFVRSKDPILSRRVLHGFPVSSIWEPSDVCQLHYDFEPTEDVETFLNNEDISANGWGTKLLDVVWKVVRSQTPLHRKQARVQQLVLNAFSKMSTVSRRKPVHDEGDRQLRLDVLACLLDALRLAREVVTDTGEEAAWFSRACTFLGASAATVAPAAKAAVELFQAESRAHCGVKAVITSNLLEKCAKAKTEKTDTNQSSFRGRSGRRNVSISKRSKVPSSLRQSVVDVMHALYWRTKAGFDDSSDADSFERLIHADVASSLFLTGSGISPVDGTAINLDTERELLNISEKKRTKSDNPNSVVDETRRVSTEELVQELQSLWLALPSSAGLIRAKVSYALAHYSRVEQKDYSRAERFLFDGLRSIHAVINDQVHPHSFFSRMLLVSPISVVSSPLSEAILRSYGALAVAHSKYRYGIAALEAATDALRVRNMNKQPYRVAVTDLANTSSQNNDWRRSLVLLYSLRATVHPKDNLRNEFLQLCLKLHRLCFSVGCFEASIVPLRAYSALIYEERLRVLLQRYRRRLAKKSRNGFRRHIPMPTGSSVFFNGTSALASFFETPIVNSAVESSLRHSAAIFDMRPRSTSAVVPVQTTSTGGNGNSSLKRIVALLWPTPVQLTRPSSTQPSVSVTHKEQNESVSRSVEGEKTNPSNKSNRSGGGVLMRTNYAEPGQFEEEQRELLRIAAEQEVTADSDRFQVELLRAQTEYAKADFDGAELRCRGLLDMRIPHACRYQVYEIMARIRLKRRELTRCLELIDQMEHEYTMTKRSREPSDQEEPQSAQENARGSIFRLHESGNDARNEEKSALFIPQVTFLRLSALLHSGRLNEALYMADKAIDMCEEHSFWDLGRLHYLRGRALYEMSSCATAPFQREQELSRGPQESTQLNLKITELTMEAFETASRYYDAACDEICTAKADLQWARTCIDFLFRCVVLPARSGGAGLPLNTACLVLERSIVMEDVVDAVYSVINVATTANVPLLLIDAMTALAEIKCIQKQNPASWMFWVLEAWKLFSRLFIDAENYTVVLKDLAPVSVLFRLRNLCGRMVRLVMCGNHPTMVSDTGRHLRLFEAYVTLQLTIDRKMNLASNTHKTNMQNYSAQQEQRDVESGVTMEGAVSPLGQASNQNAEAKRRVSGSGGMVRIRLPKANKPKNKQGEAQGSDVVSDGISETASEKSAPRRPAGAFLHILGDEGVALGRQGFSVFINRPRQQVISAVKGTGAVLIPTNFFSNSKAPPGNQLGTDAEMIFPFKPSLGLGAVQILDDGNHASSVQEMIGNQDIMRRRSVVERTIQDVDENSQRESEVKRRSSVSFAAKAVGVQDEEIVSKDDRQPRIEEGDQEPKKSKVSMNKAPERAAIREKSKNTSRNELALLVKSVQEELDGGSIRTKGSSSIYGANTAERVWAHMHRIKTETNKYKHGEITLQQLGERNSDALLSWVHCIPLSRKEWVIPESVGRRLVYILYAHGVVGYYVVDQGGSVERVAFGGKQNMEASSTSLHGHDGVRGLTEAEKLYLYELVHGFKRDGLWHKERDSEVVSGMGNSVLRAPRHLLGAASPAQKSRSRPIVLVADLALQLVPWELFFDHVVIRSHSLLQVIRGLQDSASKSSSSVVDPSAAAARRLIRFMSFGPSRREVLDLERTEEARRQQLAFQGLLRLNVMNPSSLIAFLGLGGFSDPTALNAVARPTGPLSTPLSQSRKAVKLFGLRVAANIGRRNYPHVDFLKVAGLGSATTGDLKEAAMVMENVTEEVARRDVGAYLPVFLFSYADLVDASDSVFGLQQAVPGCILMFTPAIHMKVLVRHLEDDELTEELHRVSGRMHNRVWPDVSACARVLVENVSRFSREKRIPIVVFLGQQLVDVFPRKKGKGEKVVAATATTATAATAADRLVQFTVSASAFS